MIWKSDTVSIEKIVSGEKDYDFRKFLHNIPKYANIWLYNIDKKALTHVMRCGPAKLPGQIDKESNGLGNEEFNSGTLGLNYAHRRHGIKELAVPIGLETLQTKYYLQKITHCTAAPGRLISDNPLDELVIDIWSLPQVVKTRQRQRKYCSHGKNVVLRQDTEKFCCHNSIEVGSYFQEFMTNVIDSSLSE
ncbi:hypothetical protein HDU76_006131, partial [Blyttiomyces sp. JEL0837]